MFLKQIKIVGFKSFVEPTLLYFNHPIVAVVGPNGCGKSNVIDAIRWVMGESSPKFLRGDLMSDVIFNGSVQRKPVGIASVEILLDNQNGLLQGAYVKKGDIALRREINRSGDSIYSINGQRVRRKDLTDLWLGTGAGARGYAIIGQNMVNHLVEANPEVLRGYLEEAAGVSKYKERRKESADRLEVVGENVSRIADIIFELNIQIERLQKESQDAELYHQYRESLRDYQQKYEVVKARQMFKKLEKLKLQLLQHEQAEQHLSNQCMEQEQLFIALENRISKIQEDIQKAQQTLYQQQMQCQQMEQQYQQRLKDRAFYLQEHEQLLKDRLQITDQLEVEQTEWQQLEQQIQQSEVAIKGLQEQLSVYRQQEQALRAKLKEAYHERQQLRQQLQQNKTHLQVLEAKQEQAQVGMIQLKEQMLLLQKNVRTLDGESYLEKLSHAKNEMIPLQQKKASLAETLSTAEQHLQVCQMEWQNYKQSMQTWQKTLESCTRERMLAQAAYQGLLDADIPLQKSELLQSWALKNQWMQKWDIPVEWQRVIDWLWTAFLPTYLGEGTDWLDVLQKNITGCFSSVCLKAEEKKLDLPRLVDFLKDAYIPASLKTWTHIYLVDSENELLAWQPQLNDDETLLTANGIWAGRQWLYRIPLKDMKSQGLATRLNVFQKAEKLLQEQEQRFAKFKEEYAIYEQKYEVAEEHCREQRQLNQNCETDLKLAQQQVLAFEQQYALYQQEQNRQRQERERAEHQYAQMSVQFKEWQENIETLKQALMIEEQKDLQYSESISELQLKLNLAEENTTNLVNQEHQQRHVFTKLNTQKEFYKNNVPKLAERLHTVTQRLTMLEQSPVMQTEHESALLQQIEQLKQLVLEAQTQYEQFVHQVKLENQQKIPMLKIREDLKQQHLAELEKKWRIQTEVEQLQKDIDELTHKIPQLLDKAIWKSIPETQGTNHFKDLIKDYEHKLQNLGDVNLLAVGLYQQEKTRFEQLVAQEKDLQDAMAELKHAIETLDDDMQQQLQLTLQQINQQLDVIFPKLFGGGEAKFSASCDNLLEATVSVQVQLPGKKQHRIQLLSGGEKALTAVALLFSIFSLNPAPFCLLDEVDAALDDANVQRLANLIQSMSDTVQFILITHNPLTMDVAKELVGVTMQEPGVSRVVSVNMETALAMVNKE